MCSVRLLFCGLCFYLSFHAVQSGQVECKYDRNHHCCHLFRFICNVRVFSSVFVDFLSFLLFCFAIMIPKGRPMCAPNPRTCSHVTNEMFYVNELITAKMKKEETIEMNLS